MRIDCVCLKKLDFENDFSSVDVVALCWLICIFQLVTYLESICIFMALDNRHYKEVSSLPPLPFSFSLLSFPLLSFFLSLCSLFFVSSLYISPAVCTPPHLSRAFHRRVSLSLSTSLSRFLFLFFSLFSSFLHSFFSPFSFVCRLVEAESSPYLPPRTYDAATCSDSPS